jgi:DNA-binding response OmpR family regulator
MSNQIGMLVNQDVYDNGLLRVEHDNHYIECGGKEVLLPRKAFLILSRLARNADRIVKSEEIWRYAWGTTAPYNCASLRVHISRIRHALAPYGIQIESMVNVGYRLTVSTNRPRELSRSADRRTGFTRSR